MSADNSLLSADVLVIGGTAAGCAAAIAAARMGASVIVLEPTSSLGGTTTNGVHCFDTGTLPALSGIAEEFIGRIRKYYKEAEIDHPMQKSASDVFWEFHVAESVWRGMIAEQKNITFISRAVPVGVNVCTRRIEEVLWEHAADAVGNPSECAAEKPGRVRATTVIDASYEGDVAAWSGVKFDLGREGYSAQEPHAGVIYTTTHEHAVSAKGFLPGSILPGSTGAADDSIMSFTCRLSLRYRPSGFEPYVLQEKPALYDSSKYRWRAACVSDTGEVAFGTELIPSMCGKVLTNQRYFGDDRLSESREYILAHPRDRTAIRKRFYDHVMGFLYFIQHEGGTPQLGLTEDEYPDNNNIPHSLYVREGRRFRGRQRLTEFDINPYLAGEGPRPPHKGDSIAVGDWAIESRRCSDELNQENGAYDGSMFIRQLRAPYQVPFDCLITDEIDNLAVTTTISASHVAFSALRVEALWTEIGMAAGISAAIAARDKCNIVDVSVETVQDELLAKKCKLIYFSDVDTEHSHFKGIQWLALRGVVPKDSMYRFFPDKTATWADFIEAIVLAYALPISVTGIHFEGIDPGHASFRFIETLYDLASRTGAHLFENMQYPVIDAPAEHLRRERRVRWLSFLPDADLAWPGALAFLDKLSTALGHEPKKEVWAIDASGRPMTRGEVATCLYRRIKNTNAQSRVQADNDESGNRQVARPVRALNG